jgi:hypothetical protein
MGAKLSTALSTLVATYERHLKGVIGQKDFKISQLSAEDRRSLMALWMRGRKLLELYEHYVKRRNCLTCRCLVCSAQITRTGSRNAPATAAANPTKIMHESLPVMTPLSLPSKQREEQRELEAAEMARLKSKPKEKRAPPLTPQAAFAKQALAEVDAFHAAYHSQVQLGIEGAVGKEQLRAAIQSLKACCEQRTDASVTGHLPADAMEQWVSALKLYRGVYAALVDEAGGENGCMFIKRSG